ncbi:hypothetical protein QWJ07_27180 [Frankia sp. RB7]|nr:hypothetical protein [Frankia sp. RB7]
MNQSDRSVSIWSREEAAQADDHRGEQKAIREIEQRFAELERMRECITLEKRNGADIKLTARDGAKIAH